MNKDFDAIGMSGGEFYSNFLVESIASVKVLELKSPGRT